MQAEKIPLVYAVTVNWKRPQDTLECLRSLQAQQGVSIRPVIVDNGSGDDSAAVFRRAAPEIHLIEAEKNLGFAGGFNTGMRYCLEQGAEWILIINNDTVAAPEMTAQLMAAFSEDTAAAGPLIYFADRPEQVWSQGSAFNWLLLELADPLGRRRPLPTGVEAREFLSGCCLLLRRKALEQVGLLDEGFFLYYEDQDWCLRFHQQGWKLVLAPAAHLWHKVSLSSGGSSSPNERYWMARSSIRYFRKHVRGLAWLAVIPWRLGSALKLTARLLGNRRTPSLKAYWNGLRDGLRQAL